MNTVNAPISNVKVTFFEKILNVHGYNALEHMLHYRVPVYIRWSIPLGSSTFSNFPMFTILNKWCPPDHSLPGLDHPQHPASLPPTTSSDHQPPPTPSPAAPSQDMDSQRYVQMRKVEIKSVRKQSGLGWQQAAQSFSQPGSQGALVCDFIHFFCRDELEDQTVCGWQRSHISRGEVQQLQEKFEHHHLCEKFNFTNTTSNAVSNYYDEYEEDEEDEANIVSWHGEGLYLFNGWNNHHSPDENSWFKHNNVYNYKYEDNEMDGEYYEDVEANTGCQQTQAGHVDRTAEAPPLSQSPPSVKDVDDVIGYEPAHHHLAELEDQTVENLPHIDPDV
ncbi:hypothetical protein BJ322DRAFT_1103981 [Thelephora terrestris]|uniref:Uncharacterized protein n=1 Tax=Thelephora terrestris TaxID=56493 RepID=A0A9P6HNA8_9AGAM|nr:hypothetical protein BJ322DRAFT_1103981 [Thelephora terrestris]